MAICEGLPGNFAQKPQTIAAFEAYKPTSRIAGVGATWYVRRGVGRIVRQQLFRCRNYGNVNFIRRNCRNCVRKAAAPVTIHRRGLGVVRVESYLVIMALALSIRTLGSSDIPTAAPVSH